MPRFDGTGPYGNGTRGGRRGFCQDGMRAGMSRPFYGRRMEMNYNNDSQNESDNSNFDLLIQKLDSMEKRLADIENIHGKKEK